MKANSYGEQKIEDVPGGKGLSRFRDFAGLDTTRANLHTLNAALRTLHAN
jgi:hypothetical protein